MSNVISSDGNLLIVESRQRKAPLCYNCISSRTLFTISIIVGAILVTIGILGLAGYFSPESGMSILSKLNSATNFVAIKLGSDLFTLSMFVVAPGAAFTLAGIIGIFINPRLKVSENKVESTQIEDV